MAGSTVFHMAHDLFKQGGYEFLCGVDSFTTG